MIGACLPVLLVLQVGAAEFQEVDSSSEIEVQEELATIKKDFKAGIALLESLRGKLKLSAEPLTKDDEDASAKMTRTLRSDHDTAIEEPYRSLLVGKIKFGPEGQEARDGSDAILTLESELRTIRAHDAGRNGDFKQAETLANEAVKLDPGNSNAWQEKSRSEIAQDKFTDAEKSAQMSIALNPRQEEAWGILSAAKLARGDTEGATQAAQMALAINPASPRASVVLEAAKARMAGPVGPVGGSLPKMPNLDLFKRFSTPAVSESFTSVGGGSLSVDSNVVDLSPAPEPTQAFKASYSELAPAMRSRDWRTVDRIATQALMSDMRDRPEPHIVRARARAEMGMFREALADIAEVEKLGQGNRVQHDKAKALAEVGDLNGALLAINRAIPQLGAEGKREGLADAYAWRGGIQEQRGELKEAHESYAVAAELSPQYRKTLKDFLRTYRGKIHATEPKTKPEPAQASAAPSGLTPLHWALMAWAAMLVFGFLVVLRRRQSA